MKRIALALGLLGALTACNGAGAGSEIDTVSAGRRSGSHEVPPGAGLSGTQAVVGESCEGADKRCLGIHFVVYKDSAGKPTATVEQSAAIIATMNRIWGQCGIGFQIENYEVVNPATYGLAYGQASQSQTDQIRRTFATSNDQLLSVTTGPWGTAVNAWTAMPGENAAGAIMESGIVAYGGGIIYAHEFGHYLGLDHASSTSNLMNPVIYSSSTDLSDSQCAQARSVTDRYWSAMLRQ